MLKNKPNCNSLIILLECRSNNCLPNNYRRRIFINNLRHISYHGLAGKRIGFIAFLLITVFGRLTLIYKVNKLKTTSYLLRLNGGVIFFTLITMAVINWYRVTAHYNLGEIDVDYYLKLEESDTPLILKNIDIVDAQMEAHLTRKNK